MILESNRLCAENSERTQSLGLKEKFVENQDSRSFPSDPECFARSAHNLLSFPEAGLAAGSSSIGAPSSSAADSASTSPLGTAGNDVPCCIMSSNK